MLNTKNCIVTLLCICILFLFHIPLRAAAGAEAGQSDTTTEFSPSPLAPQPEGIPWPTMVWPRGALEDEDDQKRLVDAIDAYYTDDTISLIGEARAVLVVQQGRIIAERYDSAYDCDQFAWTGSIAKMMGPVITGLLVKDGRFDIHSPSILPAWNARADDPRQDITMHHLLSMTSGLEWDNPYASGSMLAFLKSHFMEMAFGRGFKDSARYSWERPLVYEPGSFYLYNDGLPSILGYIFSQTLGGQDAVSNYVDERLLNKIGMTNSELEFDVAGNWYGASGVRWSPCDLARFLLLLSRDGIWEGERILPEGWVDYMRTATPASLEGINWIQGSPTHVTYGYGANTRVSAHAEQGVLIDGFGHLGFGGSEVVIIPNKDAIVIVYGNNAGDNSNVKHHRKLLTDIISTLPNM